MLAKAINARFEVIDRWYDGHVEKIDADILARICFVLECTPGILYDMTMEIRFHSLLRNLLSNACTCSFVTGIFCSSSYILLPSSINALLS